MTAKMRFTLEQLVWGVEEVPGEQNAFLVQSKTDAGVKYKVDLQDFDGNGSCCCDRFLRWGLEAKLRAGILPSEKTECEHVKRAKRWYTFKCLAFDAQAAEAAITRERIGGGQ